MNVFDFAMQMEKEGEGYYRILAQQTNNKGLKTILVMLADDEVKHFTSIQKMKENKKTELQSTAILSHAKKIFQEMNEEKNWLNIPDNQAEVYSKALDIENKSFAFYISKMTEIQDPNQKKTFLLIAEEEKRHAHIINNIIQFVSRPQSWLENAEFNHLDEY